MKDPWIGAALAVAIAFGGAMPVAAAQLIVNGAFATGDFTGWTLFTTSNGTLGSAPDPRVTAFDVTGHGAANAAEFNVGDVVYSARQEGGGLAQSVTTVAGTLKFFANIAVYDPAEANEAAGEFMVLINDEVEDAVNFHFIGAGETDRGVLSFTAPVSSGVQDIEILMTRPFVAGCLYACTPLQYVTNVTAINAPLPEPDVWALMVVGLGGLGALARRRRTANHNLI